MVSATSDGAAVNTGVHNGLLTKIREDNRPWLFTIHCICHRVKLAMKQSDDAEVLLGGERDDDHFLLSDETIWQVLKTLQ